MKKKLSIILGVFIGICIVGSVGLSYFIGVQVFDGSTQLVTPESTSHTPMSFWERNGMEYDVFCETYEVETLYLTSTFDGHQIPVDYIYGEDASDKDNQTVVMVHGLGGNRYANYPIATYFLEQGYNVLTYDQRSSNENTAPYTTFGYWEKYDLIDCIDYVANQAPEAILGVWGTSFGGATAGLAIGYEATEEKVDFLILDCPVSSMKWMIEETLRSMDMGIPIDYMAWCGNRVNQLKLDFKYEDADTSKALAKTQIPVLIINSASDTLTPQFMGQAIYDAIEGDNKTIWTVPDSEHVMMWLDYNETYKQHLSDILDKVRK